MKQIILIMLLINTYTIFGQDTKQKTNIRAEAVLTIGGDTEDEKQILGKPTGIGVDDFGNIFIIDVHAREVLKFDKNGKYLKSFAKEGNGPGEIRYGGSGASITDNNKMVSGGAPPREMRVQGNKIYIENQIWHEVVLDNEGKYLETRIIEHKKFPFKTDNAPKTYITGNMNEPDEYVELANGNKLKIIRLSLMNDNSPKAMDGRQPLERKMLEKIFLIDKSGKEGPALDSIVYTITRTFKNARYFTSTGNCKFDSEINYKILPDNNIVLVNPFSNEIKLFNPDGKLLKSVKGKTETRKISNKEFEQIYKFYKVTNSNDQSEMRSVLPKICPHYLGIFTNESGTIFMKTNVSQNKQTGYDVFSKNLEYLGRVWFPEEFMEGVYCYKNNHFYQILSGDEEFASVKKYRLVFENTK